MDPPGPQRRRPLHRRRRYIWRGLGRRLLLTPAPTPTGLWPALAARVDPAQYRPHAVPDVAEEQITDGDQAVTVIRSPRGNFLRA
ncbi:MAG: hypothetical protein U0Z44_05960 [Kouleothrix sp.]